MTSHATMMVDDGTMRRSPWIVIVDAALPVVPSLWAVIDFVTALVRRLARRGSRRLGSSAFPGAAR